MPWLHRLACLRDDVVFLIYLYQRWIYPEDARRRNEFVSGSHIVAERHFLTKITYRDKSVRRVRIRMMKRWKRTRRGRKPAKVQKTLNHLKHRRIRRKRRKTSDAWTGIWPCIRLPLGGVTFYIIMYASCRDRRVYEYHKRWYPIA